MQTLRWLSAVLAFSPFCWHLPSVSAQVGADPKAAFEELVLPIFQAKCVQCHGAKKQKAGLDLRTRAAIVAGGESGPGLNPGKLGDGLLWGKIASDHMPPGKDKLTAAEKAAVRRWLEAGAPAVEKAAGAAAPRPDLQVTDEDRQFWAFRPPVRPALPNCKRPHAAW